MLIWRRDAVQRQINVEATLRTSTLEFTTLNNVESTSMQRCHFQRRFTNVEPGWNNVVDMTIQKMKK